MQQYRQQVQQEVALLKVQVHRESTYGEHNSKLVQHQATFHQHLEREMMISWNTNSGILRVDNERCMLKQLSISHRIMSLSSDLLEVRVVYYDLLELVLDLSDQ